MLSEIAIEYQLSPVFVKICFKYQAVFRKSENQINITCDIKKLKDFFGRDYAHHTPRLAFMWSIDRIISQNSTLYLWGYSMIKRTCGHLYSNSVV